MNRFSGNIVALVVVAVVAGWVGWSVGEAEESENVAQERETFTALDYAEITHLYSKYVQGIDGIWMDGKGKHYADAFTDDGVMQAGPAQLENPRVGREVIEKMADGRGPSSMRHTVPNIQVHPAPDGNTAEAWAYIMVYHVAQNPPKLCSHRATKDTLQRTDKGWRIKHRMNSTIETNTPFEGECWE